MSKKKKIIIIVIAVIAVLIIAALIAAYLVFSHYYGLMDYQDADAESWEYVEDDEEEETSDLEEASESEVAQIEADIEANLEGITEWEGNFYNILLIGVDSRSNSNTGRSDCMILITINQDNNTITMTSFLRDIYCYIPGYGYNRLNTAYAYGGASLLKNTIYQNFGISVDSYMVVNFYTVASLIDAVGGVDLEVTAEEIEVMNTYIAAQNKLFGNATGTDIISTSDAGYMHLTGNQALAYARVRYVGSDFARTGRQRQVIELVYEKAMDMSAGELLAIVEEFLPQVTTDISQSDCLSLLLTFVIGGSDYTINSMAIPQTGTWSNANIDGKAVLTIDFSANASAWYATVTAE